MTEDTKNYLGIILAVAGFFFIVVLVSICSSCFKCFRARLQKKMKTGDVESNRGYGSTIVAKSGVGADAVTQKTTLRQTRSLDVGDRYHTNTVNRTACKRESFRRNSFPDILKSEEIDGFADQNSGIMKSMSQFYSFDSVNSAYSMASSTRTSSTDAWHSPNQGNDQYYTLQRIGNRTRSGCYCSGVD